MYSYRLRSALDHSKIRSNEKSLSKEVQKFNKIEVNYRNLIMQYKDLKEQLMKKNNVGARCSDCRRYIDKVKLLKMIVKEMNSKIMIFDQMNSHIMLQECSEFCNAQHCSYARKNKVLEEQLLFWKNVCKSQRLHIKETIDGQCDLCENAVSNIRKALDSIPGFSSMTNVDSHLDDIFVKLRRSVFLTKEANTILRKENNGLRCKLSQRDGVVAVENDKCCQTSQSEDDANYPISMDDLTANKFIFAYGNDENCTSQSITSIKENIDLVDLNFLIPFLPDKVKSSKPTRTSRNSSSPEKLSKSIDAIVDTVLNQQEDSNVTSSQGNIPTLELGNSFDTIITEGKMSEKSQLYTVDMDTGPLVGHQLEVSDNIVKSTTSTKMTKTARKRKLHYDESHAMLERRASLRSANVIRQTIECDVKLETSADKEATPIVLSDNNDATDNDKLHAFFRYCEDKNGNEVCRGIIGDLSLTSLEEADKCVTEILHHVTEHSNKISIQNQLVSFTHLLMLKILCKYPSLHVNYYKQLMTVMRTVDFNLLLVTVAITISLYVSLKQARLLMVFILDVIRMPNIPALLIAKNIQPNIVFHADVMDRYWPVMDLVKKIVCYEYCTVKNTNLRRIIEAMPIEVQQFWCHGKVVKSEAPVENIESLIGIVAQTRLNMSDKMFLVNLNHLEEDLKKKYDNFFIC